MSAFAMDGREDNYLWTDSYLSSDIVVMVGADSPIKSLDEFKEPGGIAVRAGSICRSFDS